MNSKMRIRMKKAKKTESFDLIIMSHLNQCKTTFQKKASNATILYTLEA